MILLVRTKDRLRGSMLAFKDKNLKTEALPISTLNYTKLSSADMKVDGFVVTSPQAVMCIPQTRLPLFCVGDATASDAKDAGYRVAEVGSAGAQDLSRLIIKKYPPQNLLHVCGDTADKSWYKLLESEGYQIQPKVVYSTTYLKQLSTETVQKINSKNYQTLVFYSAAGASKFVDLSIQFGVNLSQLKAVAFSEQVAVELKGFLEVKVATRPTESSVIEAVQKQIQQEKNEI